jgi:secretion/DNA translocation related CpaE-like protein
MSHTLLLSDDPELTQHARRMAAAAGVRLEICRDSAQVMGTWASTPVVLVGADWLARLSGLSPPRRAGVWVLSAGALSVESWQHSVQVGAQGVLELPGGEDEVMLQLQSLDTPAEPVALTVSVMAGCGGGGASVLAAALGLTAAARGPSLLAATDPWGTNLIDLVGVSEPMGVGWEVLHHNAGRVSPSSLRESVVHKEQLGLLGWLESESTEADEQVLLAVVHTARRGHGALVLDLARHNLTLNRRLLMFSEELVVVTHASQRCLEAVRRTLNVYGNAATTVVVRQQRSLDWSPEQVRQVTGARDVWLMPVQRKLDEHLDLGYGPLVHSRGPLAKAAQSIWAQAARKGVNR